MQTLYRCIYCGCESHSPSGTGTDVSCCGEVGNVNEVLCTNDGRVEVEPKGERIEIWTFEERFGADMVELTLPQANELIEILVKVLNHDRSH